MEWIDILDEKKPKDRQLCLVTVPNRQNQNTVLLAHYAKDLYKVDKFEFDDKEGVSGFYICDDEWGYMEVEDVIGWAEIEPYKRRGMMESEKRFEELYSQASEAMENYDPIEPNVKIFEVIPESSVPEKKYSINEILEVIDDVYFNELGPIPGADIHDFYAALNARFVEGGMNEGNSSL